MDPKMVDRQSPWLTRQALISHVEPTLLSSFSVFFILVSDSVRWRVERQWALWLQDQVLILRQLRAG
ncbi:hypothetical protein Patl1_17004 [Pistacia atlantica]|uniref:Uncharacterized protein n=1 Tax=Pistacia atlantica TaxID=434234 RepID=A0ACC1BBI3_9ROSI|nr:hypothetical protein Patl1_17004 [Pistacia atlantica]